jgi:multidrug efflux pump subunit AcrB
VDEIEDRLERIQFPLEYRPELLGEYAERIAAEKHMMGVAVAALIGIFLLLQACFGSWLLATIAMLALPAAIAGGVIATVVTGGSISLGSIVGMFAVLGIAARHGLLLIDTYQRLETVERMPFGRALVLAGTQERLAPILASSAAILGALLPVLAFGTVAGLEILQPTAVVIVGGLVASTLFTLFVVPALYLAFGHGAVHRIDEDAALARAL